MVWPRGHFPTALTAPTRRVFASKPHSGPLVDLDTRHENRLALGVRTKYQRLTILQAGRQLRKCTGDVREVSHNDCVCADWKVCHLLLQPLRLRGRPALHALAIITKFDEGLRSTKSSQAHGFEGAIGGLESTFPIGILKSRSALPMAIAVFRPTSSNWRSGLLLSGFAACLSGTSRGEPAWRITRTHPRYPSRADTM
jgi:hypothetical protein